MPSINDYCPAIGETVSVAYHAKQVNILGKLTPQNGGYYVDECSHREQCNKPDNDCPIFLKLNKH